MGTEILYVGLSFCILFVFLQRSHDNASDYSLNLWKSCFQPEMLLGVGEGGDTPNTGEGGTRMNTDNITASAFTFTAGALPR